jgi:hypothetical protein
VALRDDNEGLRLRFGHCGGWTRQSLLTSPLESGVRAARSGKKQLRFHHSAQLTLNEPHRPQAVFGVVAQQFRDRCSGEPERAERLTGHPARVSAKRDRRHPLRCWIVLGDRNQLPADRQLRVRQPIRRSRLLRLPPIDISGRDVEQRRP